MEMEKSDILHSSLDLTNYAEHWTCHDGKTVILRPIRSDDKPIEKELIEGLSIESSRYRFFHRMKEATEDILHLFCDIDNKNAIAIIAEYNANDKKRNVGVVRLLVDPDQQTGEFAILVADDFQNNGLGTKFMETLINIARAKELKNIYGTVLADNYKMLQLVKEYDFTIGVSVYGEVKVTRQIS